MNVKNSTTQSADMRVPYDKAFDYLTSPQTYQEWSVNFIKAISTENDELYALTPLGKTKFRIKGDRPTGMIDLYFGDETPPISTRLLANGPGATYLFTLFKPEAMPEHVWLEQGIPGLAEELQLLKQILETRFPYP